MAVTDQLITDRFAIYNGDCMDVMQKIPNARIHLSIYSPPFGGLFQYSSSDRDLSNCLDYDGFFRHYEFVVRELTRITMPGRMTAVHCMDVPTGNTGDDGYIDFPGDIIKLHQRLGWKYRARRAIWKEPLAVRLRTMAKNLAHATIVEDSINAGVAGADYLLVFKRAGTNQIPVAHPRGLMDYAGDRRPPVEVMKYRGWTGDQIENRYSHWIWRQYASSIWDDIRIGNVLPFRDARDDQDEKHVHPLQLDVIDRATVMWSNPGETVLTPFMGVGSEVYSPVRLGRKAIGIELKPTYFRQAVKNMEQVDAPRSETLELDFDEDQFPSMDMEQCNHVT